MAILAKKRWDKSQTEYPCLSEPTKTKQKDSTDQKLEALLDLHLEQGIDSREYKKKKNQLMDQKLKTED